MIAQNVGGPSVLPCFHCTMIYVDLEFLGLDRKLSHYASG